MFEYHASGICPSTILFDIDGERKMRSIRFEGGGCSGNLQALPRLCEGMPAENVIKSLKGIQCGSKPTSCGDQFARAVEKALEHISQNKSQ
ncbi:MAG: TIGR03905 family TSCPD domain-containing protein [Spirochaetaceae bacterium]|nr:TIGR03905 family TSCPD domain-containing protein [Spirochaetaceae bacterium]